MVRLWGQRKRTNIAEFSFGQNTIIGSSATRTLYQKYILRSEYVLRRPGRCHQKLRTNVAEKVGFKVAAAEAPYIITKPIHRSQQLVERLPDGSVILEIEVVINHS